MGNPQALTGTAPSTHPATLKRRLYFGRVGRPDEALPALYKADSASTSIAAGGLLAEHRLSKDAETVETGAQIGGTRSKPDSGGGTGCQHDAPPLAS
jgi:hypothetical protein